MRESHLLRRVTLDVALELLHDCDVEWLTAPVALTFTKTNETCVSCRYSIAVRGENKSSSGIKFGR